jgi:hypothetical protein
MSVTTVCPFIQKFLSSQTFIAVSKSLLMRASLSSPYTKKYLKEVIAGFQTFSTRRTNSTLAKILKSNKTMSVNLPFYLQNTLLDPFLYYLQNTNLILLNPIAIGTQQKPQNQASGSIAIGIHSGLINQGTGSIAVGTNAGRNNQGSCSIAIGVNAGFTGQPDHTIILNATETALNGTTANACYIDPIRSQQTTTTVYYNLSSKELTYGPAVQPGGMPLGTTYSDYLFWDPTSTTWGIGSADIHIGGNAGLSNQGTLAIAVGSYAGQNTQGSSAVAVGAFAGQIQQSINGVAVGAFAGQSAQGTSSVSIGYKAGQTSQHANTIVLNATGTALNTTTANALFAAPVRNTTTFTAALYYDSSSGEIGYGPTSNSVPVGTTYSNYLFWNGSTWAVGNTEVHLGSVAGFNNQRSNAVAIGTSAGMTNQGTAGVAVGLSAGMYQQYANAVAIGTSAGSTLQGTNSIAIGNSAGFFNQPQNSIILNASGTIINGATQNSCYVAPIRFIDTGISGAASSSLYYDTVGKEVLYGNVPTSVPTASNYGDYLFWDTTTAPGTWAVGTTTIHLGSNAGGAVQGSYAVAIGYTAGQNFQGTDGIAIGREAAYQYQGSYSIAIGYRAGYNSQSANSIILNASGAQLNSVTNSSFYVSPIRNFTYTNQLFYDATNKEITFGPVPAAAGLPSGTNYSDYVFWDSVSNSYLPDGQKIHIGSNAGQTSQKSYAVAIGANAGVISQGTYAIAIGYGAGETAQPVSSIVLNATGTALNGATASAFYVDPIRTSSASLALFYSASSKEVSKTPIAGMFSTTAPITTAQTLSHSIRGSYLLAFNPSSTMTITLPSILASDTNSIEYYLYNFSSCSITFATNSGSEFYNNTNTFSSFAVGQNDRAHFISYSNPSTNTYSWFIY